MNQRYILFQRAGVYYCEDRQTGKQSSLRTRDKAEAITLLHARNETARQPILNLQMARVYLSAADPQMATRTWQMVMDEIIRTKSGANQDRWKTPNPPTVPWDIEKAPSQVQIVELLQFLAANEHFKAPFKLSIVVSAWDAPMLSPHIRIKLNILARESGCKHTKNCESKQTTQR